MSYQTSHFAHHNHVPTVPNYRGHLIDPVVPPLCNFDYPRLGTQLHECVFLNCLVFFSDTWGRVGFGNGRSRCFCCGAIVLLLTPAYSLDACRPAEQTTADQSRPNKALGLFLEQYIMLQMS